MSRNPRVVLFAFTTSGEAYAGTQLVTRAQDPAWFDAWRQGALRAIAEQDLGPSLRDLDACDTVYVIDLPDLDAAWVLVRELEPRTVLDVLAMRYLVQPPDRVDIANEIRIVFETDALGTEHAHALHTRGMQKFGLPDLVALCTDAQAPVVGQAIRELAEQLARGGELGTPRHALDVAPGVRWMVVADEHHLGELLQLGNEVRVIVDEAGRHLSSTGS